MKNVIKINTVILLILSCIYLWGCTSYSGKESLTSIKKSPSKYYIEVKEQLIDALNHICKIQENINNNIYISNISVTVTKKYFGLTLKSNAGNQYDLTHVFSKNKDKIPDVMLNWSDLSDEPCRDNYILFSYRLYFPDQGYAIDVVDAVISLSYENYYKINVTEELNKFDTIAKQYIQLNPKPELSEIARMHIVQASSLAKDKKYVDAIKLYQKAIDVDATYPLTHFNVALLYEGIEEYEFAICEMRKYLMLVPDASDARAAQDKIYEWEININK